MKQCASKPMTRNAGRGRASRVPGSGLRGGALALGLAAVLALGAGEAAAQDVEPFEDRVCTNADIPALWTGSDTTAEQIRAISALIQRHSGITTSPHYSIYCRYGRADRNNRGIAVHNPQIVVVDDFVPGIEAFHEGVGDLGIYVHAVSGEPGSAGDFIHPSPVDYGQGIFTTGNAEDYITGEDSYGIHARHTGEGRAGIDVRNVSVRTTGDYSHGVYTWQQGSYRLGEDGSAYRAPGAVIVNLIETDRGRDQRVRPLVATSGDYADAVRAEYTRAAARGHIVITVEGYTLTTGGIVPEQALVRDVEPEEAIEVSTPLPARTVFDPSRPFVRNPDHDPSDPDSLEYINLEHYVDGRIGNDFRPYSVVYLPRRNPYYDPDDPDSPEPEFIASPQTSDIAIWNGRYFLAQGAIQAEDVAACQGESTAEARRVCYENRVAARSEGNVPTGFEARGIYASHEGHGDIRIRATDNDIRTWGADAQGIYATHTGRTRTETSCTADDPADCVGPDAPEGETVVTPGGGGVSIVVTEGAIDTRGEDSHGVWARHRGDSGADEADGTVDPDDIGTGNVSIAVTDADIDTAGDHARGVYGLIQQTCTADTAEGCKEAENLVAGTGVGDIDIAVTGGSITTAGVGGAYAVHARHENTGAIAVRLTGVDVDTEGNQAHGVFAEHRGSEGAVSVTVEGGSVATQGADAHGVYGTHAGSGALAVAVTNGAEVTTKGIGAQGVRADHDGSGTLTIDLAGDVTTEGESSEGVLALHRGSGNLAIGMTSGTVKTTGFEVHGLYASHTGAAGAVTVTVSGGSVTAEGDGSAGVLAHHGADDREGALTVTVGQGASVTGGLVGVQLIADADADGNVPTSTVNVDGTVRGISSAGIYLPTGGVVNVGATGRVSGASAGIFSDGDYDVGVTVVGTVEGDVRAGGDGDLEATISGEVQGDVLGLGSGEHVVTVREGGTVTGTIRLVASTVTVDGAAGRVRVENGGTVKADVRAEGDGDVDVTVAGTVEGDVRHEGGGALTFSSEAGSTVTGTVHDPAGDLTVHGSVGRLLYGNGGTVTVAGTGRLTGVEVDGRREALRSTAGDLTVTVAGGGEVKADVRAGGDGALEATISGEVQGDVLGLGSGEHVVTVREGGTVTGTIRLVASTVTVDGAAGRVRVENGGTVKADVRAEGDGDVDVTVAGTVEGDVRHEGGGALMFSSEAGSTVTGTVHDPASPLTVHGSVGRLLYGNGGTVTVAGTGRITGVEVDGRREALRSAAGDLTVTVAGGGEVKADVRAEGDGDLKATISGAVEGDVLGLGSGEHVVEVREGGTVTGTIRLAASTVTVDGAAGYVRLENGGTVTVGRTGRITGVGVDGRREALRSAAGDLTVTVAGGGEVKADVRAEGDGDLKATISGAVEGDVLGLGSGDHVVTVREGGTVTGTIRLAASTVTLDGAAGRVWLDKGGTVTVGRTGRIIGVEVDGGREALRSAAGDLTVTVAGGGEVKADVRAEGDGDLKATISGAVEGDVLGLGSGDHVVEVREGGTVTGTIRLAASTVTLDGAAGRVWLDKGGTVTVGRTGRIIGVEVDGGREALRSAAGDLTVTVAGGGEVKADVRAEGDGDLKATISGAVEGDVLGLGSGDHVVEVREGGTVTGTIRLAASTVTLDGAAGRVWLDKGGTVTVGRTGRITGVEVDGRREAFRSDTGSLTASLAGSLMGDVLALGTGAHRITVEEGGDVSGAVRVATEVRLSETGSAVTIHGAVGQVQLDRGGALTVGPKGQIRGIGGIAVSSREGDIVVAVEQGSGETVADAVGRVNGRLASAGESRLLIQPEGEPESARPLGRLHTADAIPSGAFDLGLAGDGTGGFLVRRDIAPRARLYEALPSMMLGMNELPGFQDRMAAPRSANGGTWARVEAVGGQWKADASSTQALSQMEPAGLGIGLEYDYRRHGIQAGFDLPWGEEVLLGFSLHHRRGSAKVREGGDVEPSGAGLGFSGVWLRNDDLYVDVQAEATWYTTDLTSSIRGPMKHDLRGFGHALGVEAGRRIASGMAGMAFIPRAGLVHSKVSVGDFTDTVDSHVSLKGQRSLKGRIGVGVEKTLDGSPESRLLGSLDLEREFKDEAKVVVSGTELNSTAKATRLRLGLDGVHAWADGRYTLQGGVGYERGGGDNYELGGRLGLEVRF